MTVTHVPRFTLSLRVPGHGSEFTVGTNCSAIEVRPHSVTILEPWTEASVTRQSMRCSYSLLVTAWGWCKLELGEATPEPEKTIKCEHCDERFERPQGLALHIKNRHPQVATEPSVRTQYRRAAEQRKVGTK